MRKIELKLDLYNKANIIKTLKQYDTTQIKVEILENSEKYDLSNKTVKYIFTRKDNTIIRDVSTLTNDNVATFNLDEKCLQLAGFANFEILIYEGEELISTFLINFEIEPSSQDKAEAVDKGSYLIDIDKKLEELNSYEENEKNRIENEEKRKELYNEISQKLENGEFKGEPGIEGQPGKDGEPGQNGQDGINGKSAYQIALENGFNGTEQEWLASLKGEKR